jgi:hypothetical protein
VLWGGGGFRRGDGPPIHTPAKDRDDTNTKALRSGAQGRPWVPGSPARVPASQNVGKSQSIQSSEHGTNCDAEAVCTAGTPTVGGRAEWSSPPPQPWSPMIAPPARPPPVPPPAGCAPAPLPPRPHQLSLARTRVGWPPPSTPATTGATWSFIYYGSYWRRENHQQTATLPTPARGIDEAGC